MRKRDKNARINDSKKNDGHSCLLKELGSQNEMKSYINTSYFNRESADLLCVVGRKRSIITR